MIRVSKGSKKSIIRPMKLIRSMKHRAAVQLSAVHRATVQLPAVLLSAVLLSVLLLSGTLLLAGCGREKPINTQIWVAGEKGTFDINGEHVKLAYAYTEYTNYSGVPAVPADFLDVKAYQNGEELTHVIYSDVKMEGYQQCDKVVLSSESAMVVWSYKLIDDSPVEVHMDTGTGVKKYVIN